MKLFLCLSLIALTVSNPDCAMNCGQTLEDKGKEGPWNADAVKACEVLASQSRLRKDAASRCHIAALLPMPASRVEETLAIIKADAFARADEIEKVIAKDGFQIMKKKDVKLTLEETKDFYIEYYGQPFYEQLKDYAEQGQIRVMVLRKGRAISSWLDLIGQRDKKSKISDKLKSFRQTESNKNAFHGSANYIDAEREIMFFFPDYPRKTLSQEVSDYLQHEVNPVLLPALNELYRTQPKNPVKWLADYLKEIKMAELLFDAERKED